MIRERNMRLCVLVHDWLHEGIMWSTVTMDSPTDHFINPSLYHNYLYWFNGERQEARTRLGWINEENQTVELFNGAIRAADPKFFNKLRWALGRAAAFCCRTLDNKLESQKNDIRRYRPWVTAEDVLRCFGEPQLL